MGKGNRWNTIYEDLREQILTGKLKPGDKIPTNLDFQENITSILAQYKQPLKH